MPPHTYALAATTRLNPIMPLIGEPIDEPVVGYGPFVMNSQEDIVQAYADFNSGRLGQMVG